MGVGFQYRFPQLQGQAKCAQWRGDYGLAKSIATRSIQLAQEHRACGYEARGYRLLSEIASQEGDDDGALELISAAMEALEGYEIRNEEWQVYASASRALAVRGRLRESEQARAHAFEMGERIAATLAEPTLQRAPCAHQGASAIAPDGLKVRRQVTHPSGVFLARRRPSVRTCRAKRCGHTAPDR
jgi:hypothetical protein